MEYEAILYILSIPILAIALIWALWNVVDGIVWLLSEARKRRKNKRKGGMITKEQSDNILSLAKKYANACVDAQQEWDVRAEVGRETRNALDESFEALTKALKDVTQQT